MAKVLEEFAHDFEELYEVVRSVEVIQDSSRYKFDVLRGYSNLNVPYSVRAWIEEEVMLQPTYPQTNGKHDRKPESMRMWRAYDNPWVVQHDPDNALAQALSFLLERKSKD